MVKKQFQIVQGLDLMHNDMKSKECNFCGNHPKGRRKIRHKEAKGELTKV